MGTGSIALLPSLVARFPEALQLVALQIAGAIALTGEVGVILVALQYVRCRGSAAREQPLPTADPESGRVTHPTGATRPPGS